MRAIIYRFAVNGKKPELGGMIARALADFRAKHKSAPAAVICNPAHVGELEAILAARKLAKLAKLPVLTSGGVMVCELWLVIAPVKGAKGAKQCKTKV